MMRFLLAMLFTVVTLNIFSYDIRFVDGLHLKSVGWPERVSKWWRGKKPTSEPSTPDYARILREDEQAMIDRAKSWKPEI